MVFFLVLFAFIYIKNNNTMYAHTQRERESSKKKIVSEIVSAQDT